MRMNRTRTARSATALTGLVLALTGAGTPATAATAPASQNLVIWDGFEESRAVDAFHRDVDSFLATHPGVHVSYVDGKTDPQISAAINSGSGPDVVLSPSTDNLSGFCGRGELQELSSRVAADGVDLKQFPQPVQDYLHYQGKLCALPLLSDAYGLYYNKQLFAQAGIAHPPRTIAEFTEDIHRLTRRNSDGSIAVAGFMPSMGFYQNEPLHLNVLWNAQWFDASGHSALAEDPSWSRLFHWQRKLIDWYGPAQLNSFSQSLGDEWSPQNAFEQGKVAMMLDGEWRAGMIAQDGSSVPFATAPLPVQQSKAAGYGGGLITGNILGVARGSQNSDLAWQLVKYLATDTNAVVSFANAIENVPTTLAALNSPDLHQDANTRTFLDISRNPNSTTPPISANGYAYNDVLQQAAVKEWESGQAKNLHSWLLSVAARTNAALAASGTPAP